MKKLILLLSFCCAQLTGSAQCFQSDFEIVDQSGYMPMCYSVGAKEYRLQVCYYTAPQLELRSLNDAKLTIKHQNAGTTEIGSGTVTNRYYFPQNAMGDLEVTNQLTAEKRIIHVVPATPDPILSIELLNNSGLSMDTLFYCKKEQIFGIRIKATGNWGSCSNEVIPSGPMVDLYINGEQKDYQWWMPSNTYYLLNTDSVKTGDILQLKFNGHLFIGINGCQVCFDEAHDVLSKPVVLKIVDNQILPTPVATGNPFCAGDTVKLQRSAALKKVAWTNAANDTSLVRKLLVPTKTYLRSLAPMSQGCYAVSSEVVVRYKDCGYKMMRGYVYEDLNSNNQFDAAVDRVFPNLKLRLKNEYFFSDAKGMYLIKSDTLKWDREYTVVVADSAFVLRTGTNVFYSYDSSYYRETNIGTYRLKAADLALQGSSGRTRPGFTVPLYFTVSNEGKQVNSGTLTVTLDNAYSFVSSSPSPSSINGKTLTFPIATMVSNQSKTITIQATLDAATPLGTGVTTTGTLSAMTDNDPTNNGISITMPVVGSFDPNDIEVSPKGSGAKGLIRDTAKLVYTIRFQNMGTDTAFNIVVKNKLPQGVDIKRFEVLNTSHPYQLSLQGHDTLVFRFPNILLPDNKVNEPLSHGLIRYRIGQLPKNKPGTEIRNQAAIYFDFNTPVITNEVLNTIADITTETAQENEWTKVLQIFPNPTEGSVNIATLFAGRFTLSNNMGQVVFQTQIEESTKLDISHLNKGLYLYSFQGTEGSKTGLLLINN